MAHYKVRFSVNGKIYNTEGESSYPQAQLIDSNKIDMNIAMDSAAGIASAHKEKYHIEGNIDKGSLSFEVYSA